MESFNNNNKSNNKSNNNSNNSNNSNTNISISPLASIKNSKLYNSATSFKNSIKPITSIKEQMSSFKESLGEASNLSMKSLSNNENVSSGFSFVKIIIYIIIGILLLAFIGFNIFNYLAYGTDFITTITSPFINFIAMITGDTTKTTISNTSSGSKTVLDSSSKTGKTIIDNLEKGSNTSIDYLQKNIKETASKSIVNPENDDNLNENKKQNNDSESEPEPIRTNSLNQGYCYVGKINDTRYCAKVSGRDQCMSGDIYPSMDICVNPNLRT